jgi:CheY-like chemotaxis protein
VYCNYAISSVDHTGALKGILMPKPNGKYVFVVDDEQVIASTLAVILQQSGFVTTAFTNPLEALDSAQAKAPDLLISDVMMPQITGVELAIRLQAICPDCRVLLFSGQAQTADLLQEARKQGHNFELLSKPIHPADLLNGIRSALSLAEA